jgi:hypothetical protein
VVGVGQATVFRDLSDSDESADTQELPSQAESETAIDSNESRNPEPPPAPIDAGDWDEDPSEAAPEDAAFMSLHADD